MKTRKVASISFMFMMALSGCSSVNTLENKVAALQYQHLTKTMPDGSVVHFDVNLVPATSWNCVTVGTRQSYNWEMIQFKSQFALTSPSGLLMQNAIDYLKANQLTANYVNMSIPSTTSLGVASGNSTTSVDLDPNAAANLDFYTCQAINPEHRLGNHEETAITVGA